MGHVNLLDVAGNVATGGLLSVGENVASGNLGKALSADPGVAGITESVGRSTIGPQATQIARSVIGTGAGLAAAGAGAPGTAETTAQASGQNLSPTQVSELRAAGTGTASTSGPGFGPGVGASPSFVQGVSGGQATPVSYVGLPTNPLDPTITHSYDFPVMPTSELVGAPGGSTQDLFPPPTSIQPTTIPPIVPGLPSPQQQQDPNVPPPSGTPSAPPSGTPSPTPSPQSNADWMKALFALQAMQAARGFMQPNQPQSPTDQGAASYDPEAQLAKLQAQQQQDEQQAILASLPRTQANLASSGLSDASPDLLALMNAQNAGYPGASNNSLDLIMAYLGNARHNV